MNNDPPVLSCAGAANGMSKSKINISLGISFSLVVPWQKYSAYRNLFCGFVDWNGT
jgi:hypothetical protein